MVVLVEDSAQAVSSAYVEVGDLFFIADRFGCRAQGCCLLHGLVGAVLVVELLVLAQGVPQVGLVADEGSVQQFVAAGLHPAFHDRVHPWHLDTSEHGLDAGIGEDFVDQGGTSRRGRGSGAST
ncbi:MAG: Transposase [Amycolatopsis sp.]|nr:Transposase [Amycolatopsis sp.]